ncbi:MAG: class I tRNA ligase family protein, partial [Candidatus Sumerlaeota bacterium]
EFVPEGFTGPDGEKEFEKEYDILDVWFDSGSSHISVLEADEMLDSPADLYLEGSDQHRGWFMSSLLVSMAARDRAPYKSVLTHGFLLDGEGVAMSKSKGNTISPLKIVDQMGADVLRLWVISEDFRADMRASDAIFKQMMETYRRVRNTLRFMLGNLEDFNPEKNTVPVEKRTELDRWALTALAKLVEKVTGAFDDFAFHRIYHLLNQFCVVTMSSLYMDILKDRLYCSAPDDLVRRSAQSTVHDIFTAMVRMIAPVTPFTADEAYEYSNPARESIHLEDWPEVEPNWKNGELSEKWERLLSIREVINPKLEEARREKKIGKSLDAGVVLRPRTEDLASFIESNAQLLKEVCIVSELRLDKSEVGGKSGETLSENMGVEVVEPAGEKCARCWTFAQSVGSDSGHPELCDRCSDAVRRLSENG